LSEILFEVADPIPVIAGRVLNDDDCDRPRVLEPPAFGRIDWKLGIVGRDTVFQLNCDLAGQTRRIQLAVFHKLQWTGDGSAGRPKFGNKLRPHFQIGLRVTGTVELPRIVSTEPGRIDIETLKKTSIRS